MIKIITIIFSVALLASCATYRPIVDMRGVDQQRYDVDLAECQQYAEQISPGANAVVGAVVGTAIGAIVGGLIGAVVHQPRAGAKMGAAIFGTQTAVAAGAEGAQGQVDVISNCMMGRGYNVLR